jgi:hypothetical protein
VVAVDVAIFLEEEGFREVECTEEEYYDEFGGIWPQMGSGPSLRI